MVRVLRVRACSSWRRVQPATHRGANEKSPGDDAGDANIPHRLDVVFRQAQPVNESPDAQEDHPVAVRALRPPRFLQRHSCNMKEKPNYLLLLFITKRPTFIACEFLCARFVKRLRFAIHTRKWLLRS